MSENFFALVNNTSRFWLPALLHEVAKIPLSLCPGDGCSILLICGEGIHKRLHLAATTRSERLSDLFAPEVSYIIDPDLLRLAAEEWKREGSVAASASLSGWVAAFNKSLAVNNLHNPKELDAMEINGLPRPIWSYRNRGPQDYDTTVPRPFLCVPLAMENKVIGAIRINTTSRNPRSFLDSEVARLTAFADSLAALLIDSKALENEGLHHIFRIWGAEDVDSLGDRITEAIPELFKVECCSFFLRDPMRRFVLRKAGARDKGDSDFCEFVNANTGRLYYRAEDGSKTALCIDRQRPVILTRASALEEWSIRGDNNSQTKPQSESSGKYTHGAPPRMQCEFPHDQTRTMLLVPVRDHLSTYLPAGVLRILSRNSIDNPDQAVTDMLGFAEDLGGVIGRAWRDDQQRKAQEELVKALTNQQSSVDSRIAEAARIACDAVDAGAVTIFVREWKTNGQPIVTKPEYSVLAAKYNSRGDLKTHHERFKETHHEYREEGCERTAWVIRENRTLNLKTIDDAIELGRKNISPEIGGQMCEIPQVGPFLAVPISSPTGRVEGVIRAVRRKGTLHGSFSLAHEEVLGTCGTVLASLLSALRWKAVLSYSTHQPHVYEEIKGWVESLDGELLALTDRTKPNLLGEFKKLCSNADLAIIIASVDIEEKISDWVEDELQSTYENERLKTHRIILEMEGAKYRRQGLTEGAKVIPYSRGPAGILVVRDAFVTAVRSVVKWRAKVLTT